MSEQWRFQKRGGFYADLVWRDDEDGHQTLMAETHWPGAAEQIVADHNNALAARASDRDELEALAPVVAWIKANHVMAHDSDTLDVDHGPIVEWDYCDWCSDHGLAEDWPCMFIKAVSPELAALAVPAERREDAG